jgi:hypothetical protein
MNNLLKDLIAVYIKVFKQCKNIHILKVIQGDSGGKVIILRGD